MTVPFSPEEMLARALVITRRVTGTQRPIVPTIVLGEMRIDITRREVRAGNSVVHLTSVEQSLLYVLASRPGRVFTREEIIDAVWGLTSSARATSSTACVLFVVAGLGIAGLVRGSWWRAAAMAGATTSLAGIVAFAGTWPAFDTLAAVTANLAIAAAAATTWS